MFSIPNRTTTSKHPCFPQFFFDQSLFFFICVLPCSGCDGRSAGESDTDWRLHDLGPPAPMTLCRVLLINEINHCFLNKIEKKKE